MSKVTGNLHTLSFVYTVTFRFALAAFLGVFLQLINFKVFKKRINILCPSTPEND